MKISVKIFITGIMALVFTSCNNEAIYKDEHYKVQVYLLSEANNIYETSYTLNEYDPVRYVSVGCGGSNTNGKDIVVTLEPYNAMLDKYNSLNYDYEDEYAKLLPANKYVIGSYSVTIPAYSGYHYARLPVIVYPKNLSPDSMYFIPLKIKTVSEYEVNEDKQDVLFRVAIENDYAKQIPPTNYSKSGTLTNPMEALSGTKLVQPLDKDKVRMLVGLETYSSSITVADIIRSSVVVQIHPDNSLTVLPYGTIEVEMLENLPDYNRYDPERMQGTTRQRVFYLNYRYRRMNAAGNAFEAWREVEERLIRLEED